MADPFAEIYADEPKVNAPTAAQPQPQRTSDPFAEIYAPAPKQQSSQPTDTSAADTGVVETGLPKTDWGDVGRSARRGAILGAGDIFGLPGTIGQGVDWVSSKLGHDVSKGPTPGWGGSVYDAAFGYAPPDASQQSADERGGYANRILGVEVPTGAGVERLVKQHDPTGWTSYEPQTTAGKIAGESARFGTGALTTGGAGAWGEGASTAGRIYNLGKTAAIGAGAGAGSEIAGSALETPGAPAWAGPAARTVGAVFGGGATHLGMGAMEGVGNVLKSVAMPNAAARTELEEALAKDLRNQRGAMSPADIARAHNSGLKPSIYDMGGPETRAVLGRYGQLTPEAQEQNGQILKTLEDRKVQAGAVTGKYIDDLHGGNLDPAKQRAAMQQEAKQENGHLYNIAQSDPNAHSIYNNELHQFAGSDVGRAAMTKADSAASAPWSDARGFVYDADGNATSGPNLAYWDQAKRHLDDQISVAQRAGAYDDVRNLTLAKNWLVGSLDREVPAYATARNTAAEFFGAGNSLDAGYNSMKNMNSFKSADVMRAFSAMSPDQRNLFRQGAASWLKEQSESRGPGFVVKTLSHPSIGPRAQLALGQDNFGKILDHAASNESMTKVGAPLAPTSAASHPWAKPALGGIGGGLVDLALSHTMPGATGMMLGAGAGEAFKLAQDAARGRAAPALLRGVQADSPDAVRAAILAAQTRPERASMFGNANRYIRNRAFEASRVDADRENQPRELTVHSRASGGHVGPDLAAAYAKGWQWNGRGWEHRANREAGGAAQAQIKEQIREHEQQQAQEQTQAQAWEQQQDRGQALIQQTLKAALAPPLGTPPKIPPPNLNLMGQPQRSAAENSYQRGGTVRGHQHLVDRLFAAVERAKREEKANTSGLLRQPDEAVAKALKTAWAAI